MVKDCVGVANDDADTEEEMPEEKEAASVDEVVDDSDREAVFDAVETKESDGIVETEGALVRVAETETLLRGFVGDTVDVVDWVEVAPAIVTVADAASEGVDIAEGETVGDADAEVVCIEETEFE